MSEAEGTIRTWVYVDGFNLYYGAVKGTPYKWLNLVELAKRLLPSTQRSNELNISRLVYPAQLIQGLRAGNTPI